MHIGDRARVFAFSQATLEVFKSDAAAGATVDDKTLSKWLEPSFWALPSDQHRQMFLDAATLMHGQPQAHLLAAWVAHVQLDAPAGLSDDAAGLKASSLLAELITSSLTTIAAPANNPDDRCALCRLPTHERKPVLGAA